MEQKILVIQTAFLGDALLSIPILRSLRNQYPKGEIHFLCRKGFGEFFEKLSLVNKSWEVDKKSSQSRKQVLGNLKNYKFDFIFSPHESIRTAFWVQQLTSNEKIGFKKWWNSFIFTKHVNKNKNLPDALRQLSILGPVNDEIKNNLKNYTSGIPNWADMTLTHKIEYPLKWNLDNPIVFLAPGSVWATKRWTTEGYRKVAQTFSATHTVVFIGSKEERELCETIKKEMPNSLNLAGETSILDLFFLFQKGSLLICNDSGAMHLASAAGLPTVAIFGPTVLELGYQPWQKKAIVVEKPLPCRPCGKHGHKECPIGTHACMKDITPQEVIKSTSLLLGTQ